jgi:hypothetical protein
MTTAEELLESLTYTELLEDLELDDNNVGCAIDWCDKLPQPYQKYCPKHRRMNMIHGTPLPLVKCYECKNEFVYSIPGSDLHTGNVFRCPKCSLILKEYEHIIFRKSGSIRKLSDFNITRVQYINILISQDFKCANIACRSDDKILYLDHDHKCCPYKKGDKKSVSCGKCIRGLVCRSCNIALGWMESERAKGIPEYLSKGYIKL